MSEIPFYPNETKCPICDRIVHEDDVERYDAAKDARIAALEKALMRATEVFDNIRAHAGFALNPMLSSGSQKRHVQAIECGTEDALKAARTVLVPEPEAVGEREPMSAKCSACGLNRQTIDQSGRCVTCRTMKEMLTAHCRGCGMVLGSNNYRIADGCPCNSPRGINHGLVNKDTCTCLECDPKQTGSARIAPETKQ